MRTLRLAARFIGHAVMAVVVFVLICNLCTIAATLITGEKPDSVLGFGSAVVISGSMEPAISVEDLVVYHWQKDYQPGDIITYRSNSSLVTHRVVDVLPQGLITRGDANNANDPQPVEPEKIVGRVILIIPGAGLLIEWMKTPVGMTSMILLGWLMAALPHLLKKIRRQKEEKA